MSEWDAWLGWTEYRRVGGDRETHRAAFLQHERRRARERKARHLQEISTTAA